MRSRLYVAGLATLAAAVLLLAVLQFLPWTKFEESSTVQGFEGFGFQFPDQEFHVELLGYTWEVDGTFNGSPEDESWWSDELDGEDGVGAIRTSIPFLLVGLLLLAGSVALLALRFGNAAGLAAGAAALLVLVGTILMAAGQDAFWDGVEPTWHAGLYVAIVAVLAAIAGSVLAFLPPDEEGPPRAVRPVDFD